MKPPCGKCISGGSCGKAGAFGNLYVRPVVFGPVGEPTQGEYHNYDHVTLVASGGLLLKETGEIFTAPAWIHIPKDVRHTFIPTLPGTTGFCVFALRDAEGDVVDTFDGNERPYNMRSS